MQQRLGRDTPDVQAHAAQHRPAFDQRHFEAEIGGPECRGIPTHAGAEHDQVHRPRRWRGGRRRRSGCGGRRGRRGRPRRHGCGRSRGCCRRFAQQHGGDQRPCRHFVAFLQFDRIDDAVHRRRHVHRGLLGLERYERIVDANLAAFLDEDVDDVDTLGVTEIRNSYLDDAHSKALTSPSVLARNTMKRAASAPSITRWS